MNQEQMLGIGKLGFGLMRLPMSGSDVDIEQTKRMVDLFMDAGFTYFDTAYGYIDGKSEAAAKLALVDRYPRERFQLATKLPAWAGATTKQQAEDMFWTSLKRTGVDYFDFYLLHNLGGDRSESFDRFGIWEFLAQQKREGRIRHLGFSMHAGAEDLDKVLCAHPEMEFVQLQINYADWEDAIIQSRACYEVVRKHDKPVIIMEPVKGGVLANLPASIADVFKTANPETSQASWAMRYAASLPGVITVLSGMSTPEQMQDNISFMVNPAPLNQDEQAVIARAQQMLKDIPSVPCTDCQYCVADCPQNIAIPGTFKAINRHLVYGDLKGAKGNYGWETNGKGKASECIACGLCESACPQRIAIIEELKKAAEVLEK